MPKLFSQRAFPTVCLGLSLFSLYKCSLFHALGQWGRSKSGRATSGVLSSSITNPARRPPAFPLTESLEQASHIAPHRSSNCFRPEMWYVRRSTSPYPPKLCKKSKPTMAVKSKLNRINTCSWAIVTWLKMYHKQRWYTLHCNFMTRVSQLRKLFLLRRFVVRSVEIFWYQCDTLREIVSFLSKLRNAKDYNPPLGRYLVVSILFYCCFRFSSTTTTLSGTKE